MSVQAGESIDSKFEIEHLLFIDLIGQSKLVRLAIGDGMVLVFRRRNN
jgi:hypothetical protein